MKIFSFFGKSKDKSKDKVISFNSSSELPSPTAFKELASNISRNGAAEATIGSTALVLAIVEKEVNGMGLVAAAKTDGGRLGEPLRAEIANAFSSVLDKKIVVADPNAPKQGIQSGLQPTKGNVTTLEQVKRIAAKPLTQVMARCETTTSDIAPQVRGTVVGPASFFKGPEAKANEPAANKAAERKHFSPRSGA